MTRYQRLSRLLLLAIALGALSGCRDEPPAATTRLNLVMICIDTVRYDSFAETTLPDPLDAWLESAQVYEDAFATGPWTMPSVASALTGLYPVEHGAGRFAAPVANLDTDPPSPLSEEADTLAEMLVRDGYRAAAFVAHPFFTTGLGLDQGFEPVRAARGWRRNLENFRKWHSRLEQGVPFFGYIHLMEAHDRHKADAARLAEHIEAFDPETRQDLRTRSSETACADPEGRRCLQHQLYNAQVSELRLALALVLETLRQDGLLENTVVMVYSDHGEEFWEHREEQVEADEDPRNIRGFGHGQSLYQELLHVPLLAWVPGRPGARHDEPVSLVDMVPSALEWLGAGADYGTLSGQPLPLPGTETASEVDTRVLYASGIAYGPEKIAARTGALKSIFSPDADRFVYFDLSADPHERRPLPARDDLAMLFDTLVGDYLERKSDTAVASSEFDDEQIRALKAIGYLQGVETETPPDSPPDPAPDPEPPADAGQNAAPDTEDSP